MNEPVKLGCTDGYCAILGKAKGMHTNGGCRCVTNIMRDGGVFERIELEKVLRRLHKQIEEDALRIARMNTVLGWTEIEINGG